jgi:hypothetical protein
MDLGLWRWETLLRGHGLCGVSSLLSSSSPNKSACGLGSVEVIGRGPMEEVEMICVTASLEKWGTLIGGPENHVQMRSNGGNDSSTDPSGVYSNSIHSFDRCDTDIIYHPKQAGAIGVGKLGRINLFRRGNIPVKVRWENLNRKLSARMTVPQKQYLDL